MKIIALYLPQFHCIPENDKWWGKGFTEWVNVKKAKPLCEGHVQPKVPLNHNYYDLTDIEVMRWQAKIAKEHGVYGFCFYHYWFGGKLLLEKPVEQFLKSDIDLHYCISWANEHWTNQWVKSDFTVLMEQKYGGKKEWKEHFDYLLQFFKDPRYIKIDNRPVMTIYRPEIIDCRAEMIDYWNELAKENGFDGLCMVFQSSNYLVRQTNFDLSMFDYCGSYQPGLAFTKLRQEKQHFSYLRDKKQAVLNFLEKHFRFDPGSLNLNLIYRKIAKKQSVLKFDYDEVWNRVLNDPDIFKNVIPCAFTNWDNTSRHGMRGSVIIGGTPEKFENYLKQLILKAKKKYETDLMFIFAWNEWAEGGYLEPDEENGFGYLEAIKKALEDTGEFPSFDDN